MSYNWVRSFRARQDGRDIVFDPQKVYVPLYGKFEDNKPPFWIRTFLQWQPCPIEGLWRTIGGSTYTPNVSLLRQQRIGIYETTIPVRVTGISLMVKGFENDLYHALKEYGGLTYFEPPCETDGVLQISQVDSVAMLVKLAEFESLMTQEPAP